MDFELAPDQSMLKESLTRLLADRYSFEKRRALARQSKGWSADLWGKLAELGVLGAGFAEEDGGFGGGPEEMLVIGEALGEALSAEPFLASVVMAGAALKLGEPAVRQQVLPTVLAGERILACALEPRRIRARRADGGFLLEGRVASTPHGRAADQFILAASSPEGPIVVIVDAGAPGLAVRGHRTFDGLNAAELTLEVVQAESLIAGPDRAEPLIQRVAEHAIAYLAAEAVGVMSMLLDLTLEHLKTRRQFGQPLSAFQALQHRAAEMLIQLEQARSMAIYAAMMVNEPDPTERAKAFAAVKTVISTTARFVGQNAVQLHGGIGLSEEHRAGWGLRRLTMIEISFGDADQQAARLAELGGFVEPA